MKTLTIATTITVDPGSVSDEELMERARRAAAYPFGDGHYTGDTDAEIEAWEIDVRIQATAPERSAALRAHVDRDAVRQESVAELAASIAAANAAPPRTPRVVDADLGAVQAAIEKLCHEIEQMRGMFPDEDGNIAAALQDAEDASEILGRLRGGLHARGSAAAAPVPTVVLRMSEGGFAEAHSTHPVSVKVLDSDVPKDWDTPTALVDGRVCQALDMEIALAPSVVEACLRQIEHAQEIEEALGDEIGDELQEQIDEMVCDTVMERYVAERGTRGSVALAEAEAEASRINNEGVAAQVCEIVAHGDLKALRTLAGLEPVAPAPGL